MATDQPHQGGDPAGLTSFHVNRARAGDLESLAWVVERLSPLLLAHASWRLGPVLRVHHDPQDLVDDAWAVALPRLAGLPARDGRLTPVLLRFLTTTLLYRINNLARKHIRGGSEPLAPAAGSGDDPVEHLPADQCGVVTAAVRRETQGVISSALASLDDQDREIILLRGVEQQPNQTVSLLLGLSPQAVAMRYRRALDRLRSHLPRSIFDELEE